MEPAGGFEQLAGAWAIGWANQAIALHQVNQMGSTAIPDAQPALEQGSGCLAEFEDQAHSVIE